MIEAELLQTIVLAAQAVLLAMFGYLAKRLTTVKRDVADVKHEVKNDHKTNLREEQDERHGENSQKLDYLVLAVEWLIGMAVSNRTDITDLQEHTGQGRTRRARRLSRERPPIDMGDVPMNPRKDPS